MQTSVVPMSVDVQGPGSRSPGHVRVVLAHTIYQHRAGEETVFEMEKGLLASAGHLAGTYVRENDEIRRYGFWSLASLGPRTLWAWDSYRELRDLLRRAKPDVVHFHNTFPLISPAAYYACREAGVPVVQSLHNPRLLCPAATFFRDGRVCEECVERSLFRAVAHSCYRASHPASATVALMLAVHRWLGTWTRLVDCYIVFTEFFRRKFTEAGIPGDRIVVKPHFVHPDPGAKQDTGAYALFVGRLAPEKGVQTLLSGWKRLRDIPLKVRGEGPLLSEVVKAGSASVELVPRLISKGAVSSLMRGARFLVWPSEGYYETFGCVAAEAFSCGVPVVASRIGVAEEIVEDGHTGLHFTPGNAQDLAAKVEWAWTHPGEMALMGRAARAEYEAKYTADRNYQMLMGIYQRALRAKRPG